METGERTAECPARAPRPPSQSVPGMARRSARRLGPSARPRADGQSRVGLAGARPHAGGSEIRCILQHASSPKSVKATFGCGAGDASTELRTTHISLSLTHITLLRNLRRAPWAPTPSRKRPGRGGRARRAGKWGGCKSGRHKRSSACGSKRALTLTESRVARRCATRHGQRARVRAQTRNARRVRVRTRPLAPSAQRPMHHRAALSPLAHTRSSPRPPLPSLNPSTAAVSRAATKI